MTNTPLTELPEWQQLDAHSLEMHQTSMRDMFDNDPQRFEKFSVEAAGLLLDYSKNIISEESKALLLNVAKKSKLDTAITDLFSGKNVNFTENRPALHTALRLPIDLLHKHKEKHHELIANCLEKMSACVKKIHLYQWLGFEESPITDIVQLGIGGSYLGPKIMSEALKPFYAHKVTCHYVANIDGAHLENTLNSLSAANTLFIIASKSFGTEETLANAQSSKDWFLKSGGTKETIKKHFIAITANNETAIQFGVAEENIFPMWNWVGGRYSVFSAIGLPLALAIGMENFHQFRAGAFEMDQHFKNTDLENNMPVLFALIHMWYINFFDADTRAVIPYDHHLRGFPAYLQQLEMESNGKSATLDGSSTSYATAAMIWGGEGANGQHAYHQLLHQGTCLSPTDFIMPARPHSSLTQHHRKLFANGISQSEALMQGKSTEEVYVELSEQGLDDEAIQALLPHKIIPGNQPSNTILMSEVNPETLGSLIALYEHKVYVNSIIWRINAFDQWGVELGKSLSKSVESSLAKQDSNREEDFDASTQALINYYHKQHL